MRLSLQSQLRLFIGTWVLAFGLVSSWLAWHLDGVGFGLWLLLAAWALGGWWTYRSWMARLQGQLHALGLQTRALLSGTELPTEEADPLVFPVHAALREVAAELQHFSLQMQNLAQASREGDLAQRGSPRAASGVVRALLLDVNTILDQALGPVNAQAQVLQSMAEGDLTRQVVTVYPGDHARIRNAINQVASIAARAMSEFDTLIAAFEQGDYDRRAPAHHFEGSWRSVMQGVNRVLDALQRANLQAQSHNWLQTGLAELASEMRGGLLLDVLAQRTVTYLARYADAQAGALYHFRPEDRMLQRVGGFALEAMPHLPQRFALGQGLVGQAALDRRLLSVSQLPEDYARIVSGLGSTSPRHAVLLPLLHEGQLKGVLELARVRPFDPLVLELLQRAAEALGTALHAADAASRTQQLLQETQQQAQQLQMQQEELQQQNEELEEQAQALKASEEKLKAQQEELQQSNEELEEHTQLLQQHSSQIARKNADLEQAQADLQLRAQELAQASKYKSEFLANMSHELRTPLNSMLLLARSLSDNREGNLSVRQVQAAGTMYQSGNDLLAIINDILDLSKIEAGREQVDVAAVELRELIEQLRALYSPMAEDKQLSFSITLADSLPTSIRSDRQRLAQILRNLLSNAFKFTRQGSVTLALAPCPPQAVFQRDSRLQVASTLAFTVQDTGIGIPSNQQQQIWEAFQQADGSSSRQYGGTGLGLTISRELARLLGGEIQLQSAPGQGATFTLYLPLEGPPGAATADAPAPQARVAAVAQAAATLRAVPRVSDDRASLAAQEAVILIVEDDARFAQLLADVCRGHGMKVLISPTAEEAMALLNAHNVQGVMLDMQLPLRDGWSVLSHIKQELETMHIPVYVISAEERNRQTLQHGAVGFLRKPVSPEDLQSAYAAVHAAQEKGVKSILLVEDNADLRAAVRDLLRADDVRIFEAADGASALAVLQRERLDLLILDLGLPDISGFELLDRVRAESPLALPPVIVSTGRDLSREEYDRLQRYSANVIIKGVRSDERLVEEVTLFLHRRVANLPDRARKMLLSLHDRDALFADKQVLLVDDDIRNVYSLSGVLEERGMRVLTARNGREALEVLAQHPDIDLLLTDIMMPEMDGYALMRAVRRQERHARLPVLALTAKAMQEDRDRCLEAGASDYLTKPVDLDRLLSLLRVWLYR